MIYAIYGINRIAKDFMYMFPQIDIKFFVDDDFNSLLFQDKKVVRTSELESLRRDVDAVIICDFVGEQKQKKISIMENLNMVYKTDYLLAEDFFTDLDENMIEINPNQKPVIIWGTGKNSKYFSERFFKYDPAFYVDTYRGNTEYFGKEVKYPGDIDFKKYFVVIAIHHDESIRSYLEKESMTESIDYINSEVIINQPSEMLYATIFDENQYNLRCRTPLNHVEFLQNGYIFCCCSTFMRSIGNAENGGVQSVWENACHKIVCLSVLNQTYTFCYKDMCPLLFGKKEEKLANKLTKEYEDMQEYPRVSAIGFDYTCNLKCETCRREMRIARNMDKERMMKYAELVDKELVPGSNFFIMAGDGEVFLSEAYKKIYKGLNMNDVSYIRILSNGTLFNERNWEEFKLGKKGKIMLTVSVDAAHKETYEAIRRNGNFDLLKRNMKYAGELRREGELAYFRMNFVVQKKNYKEMIDFVKWGLEIGADEVFFTKILNWGTYSEDEFRKVSMMEADGITPKKELMDILENPIMKNPIVDLGTIQYNHETLHDTDVENYYMWELERKVPDLFMEESF